MAKACGKCDPHELCEECPEWIFTLADLIMCMMGLFVLLWVLKPSPDPKKGGTSAEVQAAEERQNQVIGGIRSGFGYEPNPGSNDPIDKAIQHHKDKQNAGKGGKTDVTPRGSNGPEHEVQSVRPGKHAIVGTRILFAAGGIELPANASNELDEIVRIIQGHRQIFLVKGHTSVDDLPENATTEQKMNLSVRRAQVVADYLTGHGVEPEILRVQGCSTFEPVVQRAYTEERRRDNRRVEVEGTDNPVVDLQDAAQTTTVLPPDINAKLGKKNDSTTADIATE